MAVYKTTKEDFQTFKNECARMKKILGLEHFELIFKHEKLPDNMDGAAAEVNSVGYATLTLDKEIDEKYICSGVSIKKQIQSAARHEMCHIVTSRLYECACSRYQTSSDMYDANEELVRKIEWLVSK